MNRKSTVSQARGQCHSQKVSTPTWQAVYSFDSEIHLCWSFRMILTLQNPWSCSLISVVILIILVTCYVRRRVVQSVKWQAVGWTIRLPFLARSENFLVPSSSTRDTYPTSKRSEGETYHLLPSRSEIKNARGYASTPRKPWWRDA